MIAVKPMSAATPTGGFVVASERMTRRAVPSSVSETVVTPVGFTSIAAVLFVDSTFPAAPGKSYAVTVKTCSPAGTIVRAVQI